MNHPGSLTRRDIYYDNSPIPSPALQRLSRPLIPSSSPLTFPDILSNTSNKTGVDFKVQRVTKMPSPLESEVGLEMNTLQVGGSLQNEENAGSSSADRIHQSRRRRTWGPPSRTAGAGLRHRNKQPAAEQSNTKDSTKNKLSKVAKSGKRGRPKKVAPAEPEGSEDDNPPEPNRRGRPRKVTGTTLRLAEDLPRRRGRPTKKRVVAETEEEEEKGEEEEEETIEPKRRGRSPAIDTMQDVSASTGSFKFDSFIITTKSKKSQAKYRVKVGEPFEIDEGRISFAYHEIR